MDICDLPKGSAPEALTFEHFPTRQQAFVWRNWGIVPPERLATVLDTTVANVCELARDMGLDPNQPCHGDWLGQGHATIIRRNWHLLPYGQLLELLGWSVEKLEFMLREDDFLYTKLGNLKPQCNRLRYHQLSDADQRKTASLRTLWRQHFPQATIEYSQNPFDFYSSLPEMPKTVEQDTGCSKFSSNIVYAYAAPYGDTLMLPSEQLYPDVLLQRLAANGVNGIWLQAVLYTLVPWEYAPELSKGYEQRLKNLDTLVQRAARYGVGVYLYLNEPRSMPEWFFNQHPEWPKGAGHIGLTSLCTSNPQTLEYLSNAVQHVYRTIPGLAGAITITMSENLTHCHSKFNGQECPRCSKRPIEEVVVEVNATISRAIHQVSPQARVIAWTWSWREEWAERAIDMLPDDVELMCVSEWGLPTNVGGVAGSVKDYSMSQVGPSEMALKLWCRAKSRGLKVHAKVQINTTWECSAMPYIPVPTLVEEHLDNLREIGVDGVLASWTLGGYPGGNMPLLNCSVENLAKRYGAVAGKNILCAWEKFAAAFREFPFALQVVYLAPHNMGPANLLSSKPTNYKATMVGLPYDDLESWRSIYPEDVFEEQWAKLSRQWLVGLNLLAQIEPDIASENLPAFKDLYWVAQACYCHFRSTCLQVAFNRLRGSKENAVRLIEILDEEIELAKTLEKLACEDCRIGFEATNHYIYTPNDLREKVLNCEYLKQALIATRIR